MAHPGPPIIGPCHDALTVLTPSAMIFMICLSQDSLCVVTRVQLARLIILLVVRSTISPHQPQSMPGQIMPLRTGTAPPASQNTRHLEPPGAASQERSGSSSHPATLIIGTRHSHFPRAQIMSQNTCLTSLATPLTYFTFGKKEYTTLSLFLQPSYDDTNKLAVWYSYYLSWD